MKSISNWNQLGEYGIDCLTGEACAYGYRLLCDVTARGKRIIEACLGVEVTLKEPWNSKGIGSIMLPPHMLTPLAVFSLFNVGCPQVFIMHDGSVYGVEASDEPDLVEEWKRWNQGKFCEECRRYGAGGGIALQYRNQGYSRNQHAMSGRTE